MFWIVLGIAAAVILLAVAASLFMRFRETRSDEKEPGPATISQVSAQQQYVVRGPDGEERRFSSLDEMPEELRAAVEKADVHSVQRRSVVVRDGRREEYDSLEAVPEDVRSQLAGLSSGEPKSGITIEVDGVEQHFASREEVPEHLRRYLR